MKDQKKKKSKIRAASPGQDHPVAAGLLETVVHPNAAGIDCGATELVAAIPAIRAAKSVCRFRSFTAGLRELRDWLLEHGITTAAIESTGNYWIAVYQLLEEAGIEVWLVNARHVKGVPGRKKTDVCDARWLQQLHGAGLLSKSFRPAIEIARARYLMRHRAGLVSDASKALQHMQKVLTEMNLKLQHVLSDIDGASALAIIDAILAGERDARKLAGLRDRRCKAPLAKVLEALEGDYRAEYLFVLEQARTRWRQANELAAALDLEIAKLLQAVPAEAKGVLPPALKRHQHRLHKNSPAINIYEEAWRFFGVDLSTIDGVSAGLLAVLISELGTREQILKAFPSAGHFCSWLGLCPDNRISGGRVLSAKTRRVVHAVSAAFRLCAQALTKSKTRLGDFVRKMKARLGKAEGTTAGAHRLARIVYSLLVKAEPYDEAKAFPVTPKSMHKKLNLLKKLAAELGVQLPQMQPVAA
jgi:transposase